MKPLIALTILLTFIHTKNYGQDLLVGTLYNLKTNKRIHLKLSTDTPRIYIHTDKKLYFYNIQANGTFTIPNNDFQLFPPLIDILIQSSYSDFDFADYKIKNIPKDKLGELITSIFLIPAFWRASCGDDCFTINNEKTFRQQEIIISTYSLKYRLRRTPASMSQEILDMHYVTDLLTDLLK